MNEPLKLISAAYTQAKNSKNKCDRKHSRNLPNKRQWRYMPDLWNATVC